MMINNLSQFLVIVFLTFGAFFMVVGALGVLRFPDLYMRMSASTKSSTLGVGFILLATAIHFSADLGVATRALVTIAFMMLTAPVAAHMIGRAGYYSGSKLWKGSVIDELEGRYDKRADVLLSAAPTPDNENDTPA